VYGDDPETPSIDEGANPGDTMTFYIGDSLVPSHPPLVWTNHDESFERCHFGWDACTFRGDIDHNGSPVPDIADLVYLVAYMFSGGPAPVCLVEADINGDGKCAPDITDLVYLIDYMFRGGPAPVPCYY